MAQIEYFLHFTTTRNAQIYNITIGNAHIVPYE